MLRATALLPLALLVAALGACETSPESEEDRSALIAEAEATIAAFKRSDPSLERFFDQAAAYAVFPSVGKGGLGIGGAYGRGVVFEGGRVVGFCDLSQGTIGFQAGGQTYREIIFFETPQAIERFKTGTFEVAAQASGVLAEAGAGANADYRANVAIFTLPRAGVMGEASVGGQRFSYEPR